MQEMKKEHFDRADSSKSDDDGRKQHCRPRRRVLIPVKETYEHSMGRALAGIMVDREPVKVLNMQTGCISFYPSDKVSEKIHEEPEDERRECAETASLKTGAK